MIVSIRKYSKNIPVDVFSHLDGILDFLPDPTFVIDKEGKTIAWNKAMELMTGVPKDEIIGKGNYEYAIPFYQKRRPLLIDIVLQSEEELETSHYENIYMQEDVLYAETFVPNVYSGKGAYLWGTASKLLDVQGNVIGAIESIRDITDIKKQEGLLKKSMEKYRSIFENITEGIFQATPEGEYICVNPAFARMFGYASPDEMISQVAGIEEQPHVNPADRINIKNILSNTGHIERYEARVYRKDKTTFWVSINAHAVKDIEGNILYFEGTSIDITDKKEAIDALLSSQHKLHEESNKLHTITDNSPFGMALIDKDDVLAYVNPKFKEMFGYDLNDIPDGKTWFKKAYPDPEYRHNVIATWIADLEEFKEKKHTGERKTWTFTVTCKDNSKKIISFIPVMLPTGEHILTCEDITEKKHLESQLRQAQKTEAIGTLAGGIAHDFNNILTALMGYATLLQIKMGRSDPLQSYVDQILSASQKAADLTKSFLTFSRKQPLKLAPLNINNAINETKGLLNRLLIEDIELNTSLTEDSTIVMADKSHIDQILFNLATNARDAMPNGGTLTIKTHLVSLDDTFTNMHGFGKPGRYVLIDVSDTGIGMDDTTLEKIFDPFFTTKEVGKGTGLGLATVYGIVKQHNGYIDVKSSPYKGTTFHIYLPAADIAIDEKKQTDKSLIIGHETVLIAEDDLEVRRFISEVLKQSGYKVIEAIDGQDAIDKVRQNTGIDLAIIDSVMPKINGREAYEQISRIKPNIKVLFMSGHTKDTVLSKGIEEKRFNFIAKPLVFSDLLTKIREVLEGPVFF